MRSLDAAAVRAALPFPALVAALRRAFAAGAEVPARHVHAIGTAGVSLLMPAWRAAAAEPARYGVKIVNVFPGNAARGLPGIHGVYALFDAATGVPLAVLDGSELTARRTAAVAALAADGLARADARSLLVVGAGRVGSIIPEAMRAVRPALRDVTVWNRTPAAAEVLAARLRDQGFVARATADLAAAVPRADIVSCATLSEAALVQGAWLAEGTHLDLIGSFAPAMREADGAAFARCRVFVDTDEALAKSGDLLQAVAEGAWETAALQGTLAQLCRGEAAGRRDAAERTLFKSVGTALADLAAAERVADAA
ncbi:MAG: ornithine cyclodeaminase family protein [Rubrivivax sp.]|nr:ornithine cyclodeaminase family protein [Rubrivivax sp.]